MSGWRGLVEATQPSPVQLPLGTQQPPRFEAAEQRVHRPGTQPVAVACQFLDHPETENRTLAGVMEDMEVNEAGIKLAIVAARLHARAGAGGRGLSPDRALLIEIR